MCGRFALCAFVRRGLFKRLGQHVFDGVQVGPQRLQLGPGKPYGGILVVQSVVRRAQPIARTANREALFIKQIAYAANKQNFVVLVVASIAPTLDRFELREFLLPITQHMRLDAAQVADFANGEVTFGRNWRQYNGTIA